MNNKGFSLVEIMVAFVLTAIISTFLFRIIIGIKEMTKLNDIKTQILVEKGNLENLIYDDIKNNGGSINEITSIGGQYIINFANGSSKNISINLVDDNIITYGENTIVFPNTTDIVLDGHSIVSTDPIKFINISITNSLIDNYDFDIHIVSQVTTP